jgi:hypothetical protein
MVWEPATEVKLEETQCSLSRLSVDADVDKGQLRNTKVIRDRSSH